MRVSRLGIHAAAVAHNQTKVMYIEHIRHETGLAFPGSNSLLNISRVAESFVKPLKNLRNSIADVTVELLHGINDPERYPMRAWVLVIPLPPPSPTSRAQGPLPRLPLRDLRIRCCHSVYSGIIQRP